MTGRGGQEGRQAPLEPQIQESQRLESLGILAGAIAHDFNNLLIGVLGNASLLLDMLPADSPARSLVEEIELAGRKAAELTKQMLAYSGRSTFVVRQINLSHLIEETSRLIASSISRRATLRYHFAADLPLIEGDETQIRQVVMNLIANASDALGGQPGAIRVRTGSIRADRAYLDERFGAPNLAEGLYVTLEVSDTGSGMDEATQERIFDPFFTTKERGHGLGLSSVLGIVQSHGGAIRVLSNWGEGTTFKLLFPAVAGLAEAERDKQVESPRWRGHGKLLVADDEPAVRRAVVAILEAAGFEVVAAEDGEHALALALEHPDFVAVLLDLTMPGPSAEETIHRLRELRPGLPVILSSGYDELDVTGQLVGAGVAAFIQKPYSAGELIDTLRAVLAGGAQGRVANHPVPDSVSGRAVR